MAPEVKEMPADWFRTEEGIGVWEGRAKTVAVGVGVSPTDRRWDSDTQTSLGSYALIAARRAIEDAGVAPDQIDGLVVVQSTTTGRAGWPQPWPDGRDVPAEMAAAFKPTDDDRDGIAQLSAQWVMNNLPELTNLKFVMHAPGDTAPALVAGSEGIVRGLANTVLVIRGWHNFSGRYYVGQGAARGDQITGPEKWTTGWGVVGVYPEATRFQRYLHKYGQQKEKMANFVVNSKKNGLNFPEGFFAQNRPGDQVTREDYLNARWLAKPANLYDADMPIMCVSSFLLTTPERAKDMKQKPVYILGHAQSTVRPRSLQHTLEESEEGAARMGRLYQEAAGVSVNDLSFENMYDGYGMFHVLHLEGLGGYAGIGRGDALEYFETQDISNDSRYPISPSGGNIGSGRTRFWLHIDSIQQIQNRAGARQMKFPAEVGISAATFPHSGVSLVWSASPD